MIDITTFLSKLSLSSIGGIFFLIIIIVTFIALIFIISRWISTISERKIEQSAGFNKLEAQNEHLIKYDQKIESDLTHLDKNLSKQEHHASDKSDKHLIDSEYELSKAEEELINLDISEHLLISKLIGIISALKVIQLTIDKYINNKSNLSKLNDELKGPLNELNRSLIPLKKIISKFDSEEKEGIIHYKKQISDLKNNLSELEKKIKSEHNSKIKTELLSKYNTIKSSLELLIRLNHGVGHEFSILSSGIKTNKKRLNELLPLYKQLKPLIKSLSNKNLYENLNHILITINNYYSLLDLMIKTNYNLFIVLYDLNNLNKKDIKVESNLQMNKHIKTYSQQLLQDSNNLDKDIKTTINIISYLLNSIVELKQSNNKLISKITLYKKNQKDNFKSVNNKSVTNLNLQFQT